MIEQPSAMDMMRCTARCAAAVILSAAGIAVADDFVGWDCRFAATETAPERSIAVYTYTECQRVLSGDVGDLRCDGYALEGVWFTSALWWLDSVTEIESPAALVRTDTEAAPVTITTADAFGSEGMVHRTLAIAPNGDAVLMLNRPGQDGMATSQQFGRCAYSEDG